jgi:hypothetical protein
MAGGAYRSETDLVLEALGTLQILEAGQVADLEDVAYVREKVDATLRMLAALEICYIADSNNIPGEIFTPVADILASLCAQKFSVTPDDFTRIMQIGIGIPYGSGAGVMAIKQIMRGRPTYEPLRVYYL